MLLLDFKAESMSCTPSYALAPSGRNQQRRIDRNELNLKLHGAGAEPGQKLFGRDSAIVPVTATNIYG